MKYIVISSVLVAVLFCSCHRNKTDIAQSPGITETATEYKVIFRSYTGALVNFYVDKSSGKTRMVESVPALAVDSVTGTIDLLDYLDKSN